MAHKPTEGISRQTDIADINATIIRLQMAHTARQYTDCSKAFFTPKLAHGSTVHK
jgi:hypothetical protein